MTTMESNKQHVTVLQNRSFSSALTSSAICYGMDLIALVLDGKTVVVHRFTWQRLAMFVPTDGSDARIECLTWSPDGAILAVALSSGRVSLYGVDPALRRTKDVSAALADITLPAKPSALSWSPSVEGSEIDITMYRERASLGVHIMPPKEDRRYTLLAIGDVTGHVSLYGRDLAYSIGRAPALSVPVSRLHVADDVVIAIGKSKDGILEASAMRRPKSAEVWRAGSEVVALRSIHNELQSYIKRVHERWSHCTDRVLRRSIEGPLNKALKYAAVGAWDTLCDVHHSATLHPAATLCLSEEIGEGGAREALRTFRGGSDDVEDALLNAVQAAETLLFRASEYRALADMEPLLFAKVGIFSIDCAELVHAATELYTVTTTAVSKFYAIHTETDAFLKWFISVAQIAGRNEDDDGPVPNLMTQTDTDRLYVSNFFARHGSDVNTGRRDEFARIVETELGKQEATIGKVINKLLDAPHAAISNALSTSSKCAIRVADGVDVSKASFEEFEDGSIEACVPGKDGCILALRFSDGVWRATWSQVQSNGKAVIACSYCPENRYLLAMEGNDVLKINICYRNPIEKGTWIDLNSKDVTEIESEPTALQDLGSVHQFTLSSATKGVSMDVYADKISVVVHPQRVVLLSLGKE